MLLRIIALGLVISIPVSVVLGGISYGAVLGGWLYAKNDLDLTFMAFMLGKKGETEQAAWWFENLGYLQPSTAFLDSDAYGAAVEENPWLMLFIDALDTYSVLPVQHSYDEAGSALVRAMDRVVYDGATAEEAAASLQTELLRLGG